MTSQPGNPYLGRRYAEAFPIATAAQTAYVESKYAEGYFGHVARHIEKIPQEIERDANDENIPMLMACCDGQPSNSPTFHPRRST